MARRLKTLAKVIEDTFPELSASVFATSSDTSRRVKMNGRSFIWGNSRRHGNLLEVRARSTGVTLMSHNSAETYRSNSEVEVWLADVVFYTEKGVVPHFFGHAHRTVEYLLEARASA